MGLSKKSQLACLSLLFYVVHTLDFQRRTWYPLCGRWGGKCQVKCTKLLVHKWNNIAICPRNLCCQKPNLTRHQRPVITSTEVTSFVSSTQINTKTTLSSQMMHTLLSSTQLKNNSNITEKLSDKRSTASTSFRTTTTPSIPSLFSTRITISTSSGNNFKSVTSFRKTNLTYIPRLSSTKSTIPTSSGYNLLSSTILRLLKIRKLNVSGHTLPIFKNSTNSINMSNKHTSLPPVTSTYTTQNVSNTTLIFFMTNSTQEHLPISSNKFSSTYTLLQSISANRIKQSTDNSIIPPEPGERSSTIVVKRPLTYSFKINEIQRDHERIYNHQDMACGVQPIPKENFIAKRFKRIAGGSYAKPHSWPWMVAIGFVTGYVTCGGTLIASRWVVTAAHCTNWGAPYNKIDFWRVRVGEHSLSDYERTAKDVRIKAVHVHPSYVPRKRRDEMAKAPSPYDISLIELMHDVPFDTAHVQPLCLPPHDSKLLHRQNKLSDEDIIGYNDCWTTGWGLTGQASGRNILRQIRGDVTMADACGKTWSIKVTRKMLCFGEGHTGPCSGDSGGPLMCRKNNRFFLIGIVSWGKERCGEEGYPAVYTRVSSFVPWISAVILKNQANTTTAQTLNSLS